MQRKERRNIFKCNLCEEKQETPLRRRDGFDGEIYESCRYCGGDVSEGVERCQNCGTELFLNEKAYEIGESVYCCGCVTEVRI